MPVEEDAPIIEVSPATGKENLRTTTTQRWSRSPHPYHRRKGTIPDGTFISERPGNQDSPISPRTRINAVETSISKSGAVSRWRADTPPPSESGTEADDESGVVLKGLPAPPIRWRKGLRDAEGEEEASPLLTPSYLDDYEKRLAIERQFRRLPSAQSPLLTDEETLKIREKFTQRRRAELLRRISETAIMSFVGYVACYSSIEHLGSTGRLVLNSYLCVVSGVYISYPVRLFYRHSLRPSDQKRPWKFLRIPASFDPATLLYPVFVPLFVAMSIAPAQPGVLLPNLMLSISSIPRAMLPIHDDYQGYSSFQWFSSLVPLLIAPLSALSTERFEISSGQKLANHLDADALALLFPLHQALLPTLGYLTTTSLLPAELQLLSVAMINLLILSLSPQISILKALLWLGGIAIFCLCGHVLHWGVALARIPSWRFRHPRLKSRDANVLLSALDDCFHTRLSKWATASSTEESSNDEDQTRSDDRKDLRLKRLRVAIHKTMAQNPVSDHPVPQSARDCKPSFGNGDPNWTLTSPELSRKSQRRSTLPSYPPFNPHANESDKPPKTSRSMSSKHRGFKSLTIAQATALKGCFAIYLYTTILGIICWPIRIFVSIGALHGQEPIGWALGYLLGHIPPFRQFVLRKNLEDWTALPEPYDAYQAEEGGWSKRIEKRLQGAANVRLLLCAYCVGVITVGLQVVFRLSSFVEVDTRRKVFHGMMVVMFLPATFVDPSFVGLAFELILVIFLLLDLLRASQLPPLSKPLTKFLAPYVDGRDYRGPVIVSHIFLLIGCAIPLWLSLAAVESVGEAPWQGWGVSHRELSMVSGVICVGMGDAAASLIGRRFGRRRWCWSGGKSLEGSLAFALAVVLGLAIGRAWLLFGGWAGDSGDPWSLTLGKAAIAASGASLTESVLTGGNDNVIVPVILWLLVKGLRM